METVGKKHTQDDALNSSVSFLRENWVWGGPVLYLYGTGIGMAVSAVQYHAFGINTFDFAELNDFLLAAFRDPFVLVFPLALVAYVKGFAWLSRTRVLRSYTRFVFRIYSYLLGFLFFVLRRREAFRRFWLRLYRANLRLFRKVTALSRRPIVIIIVALLAPLLYLAEISPNFKERAIEDASRRVDIVLKDADNPRLKSFNLSNLILVGTTDRFAFFYDDHSALTIAIPVQNILLASTSKLRRP